jgi:hypothetical protein
MLTKRGIRVEFVKGGLHFNGEDSPMANLLLSGMGAFAEFERALIRKRLREGIALAKNAAPITDICYLCSLESRASESILARRCGRYPRAE